MPNVRCLIAPDYGMMIADVDLDRADAQVVAWEADDPILKQIFREGHDLHWMNAKAIWGDHIQAKSHERQLAKIFCHAANYGAKAKTLARHLGITVHQAEQILRKWFGAHPWIKAWHDRIQNQLMTTREIRNAFGFRRLYMGRIDNAFNEALAWIPQSTVAAVINHGLRNIDAHMPDVQLLLQVHDSLTFQYDRNDSSVLDRVRPHLSIVVPYPDPLIIPIGFKTSSVSWGDCA